MSVQPRHREAAPDPEPSPRRGCVAPLLSGRSLQNSLGLLHAEAATLFCGHCLGELEQHFSQPFVTPLAHHMENSRANVLFHSDGVGL